MKSRFTTIDILAALAEINKKLVGMRTNQVYDIDSKTYLIRFQRSEEKAVLLFESGIRIHTTDFQWPKNPAPSGFSMKLRKHLNNKRLESATQLGHDRIVDLQFGTAEAAYHIIIELYDRGNIVFTDHEYTILNILRPRTEGEDVKFMVKEKYQRESSTAEIDPLTTETLKNWFASAKEGDNLKRILVPKTNYGPALTEHVLLDFGFPSNCRFGKEFDIERDLPKLHLALKSAESIMKNIGETAKGFVIQKREVRDVASSGYLNGAGEAPQTDLMTNQEFHPMLYKQHEGQPFLELAGFNEAVDEFFSKLESQKLDLKIVHQEREAMKKLSNIRLDHEKRLANLERIQIEDERRARLIEMNQQVVEQAVQVIRSALANQIAWDDIERIVEDATRKGDPVAKTIKKLKLSSNHITLLLSYPYSFEDSDDEDEAESKPLLVDIDLDLSAYANARKYYGERRNASKKSQKTIESSEKAFKSAEKKARQTLKDSATIATIRKARKTHWFEKFFWFISSDNYLVVGGRERQQNELLVKRYLRAGDVYVHADLHGASSVVVKNSSSGPIPPRTLQEAGLMAVGYSAAWEAKVMTTSWWVESWQVSKTAPSGEYLTTGSFMIRGKKNFLTPLPLVLGFGLLFRLEDGSIAAHLNERKPKAVDEDVASIGVKEEEEEEEAEAPDQDVPCSDSSDSDEGEKEDYEQSLEKARALLTSSRLVSSEADVAFPDTVVDLGISSTTRQRQSSTAAEEESFLIIDDAPAAPKQGKSSAVTKVDAAAPKKPIQEKPKSSDHETVSKAKRGQKGKLKKIKEKYANQDEEERQLRMQLLQSAGPAKDKGKNKKSKKGDKQKNNKETTVKPKPSFKEETSIETENTTCAASGSSGQAQYLDQSKTSGESHPSQPNVINR